MMSSFCHANDAWLHPPIIWRIALNAALILFGVWCFLFPIRRGWPSAALVAWLWVCVEVINGIGHPT
jgi:uncharacterized membrane protein HdeD (DUF308 family)